jgi:hypothetical protein
VPRLPSQAFAAGALIAGVLALSGNAAAGVPACATATRATVAAADALVTARIYANELAGTEVSIDLAYVTGARDLVAAVARDDRAAALAAVSRIVYHPHWHIVRLRALDAAGRVLADVGGPYVIAPVTGELRSRGRVVGSFVMSVQDDAGVAKLEDHFVGDPIAIYVGGRPVVQVGAPFPSAPPAGASLSLGGVSYQPVAQSFEAFPSGTLDAVILVPPPPPALATEPCSIVTADELGRVAVRLARLASDLPVHYADYAGTVRIYTGTEVFIRRGATQLASTAGPGPATLPTSGPVAFRGGTWVVFSFAPQPGTRVYVLAPAA